MRKWRVGSLTMGFSLLLMGVVSLATIWQGKEAFDMLFQWWPLLFIFVGAEILIALALAKEDHPKLHYDLLSLFFVPVLIMVGMGFSLLSYTGLADELRNTIRAVHYTEILPQLEQQLPSEVTTIIVQAPNARVNIDSSSDSKLHLLGTYHYETALSDNERPSLTHDMYEVSVIGDKLYLIVNPPLPGEHTWFGAPGYMNLTIVTPEQVQVEVR